MEAFMDSQELFATGQMGGHNAGGKGAYAGLDQAILLGVSQIAAPETVGLIGDSNGFAHGNIPALFGDGKQKWLDNFIKQLGADFATAGQGVSFGEGHFASPMPVQGGGGGHGMEL